MTDATALTARNLPGLKRSTSSRSQRESSVAATDASDRIERPSLTLLGLEPWRAALEFITHHLTRPAPAAATGDGHPVVVFPGMGTDGRAVAPLREHCKALGYAAMDWGRGYNTGPQGDIDTWMRRLAEDTAGLLAAHGQSATLVGWSLGGLYAREVAKLLGDRVRQVITIGTPFNADADHTNVGWVFKLLSGQEPTVDRALSARFREPPPVPTTSIYSRSDGIVAWQTCRHAEPGDRVQDIEVRGSHSGLGWNAGVFKVLADRLAQPELGWAPYRG
jgi:pimeloyl-ACP methyl ester carboxylesterase